MQPADLSHFSSGPTGHLNCGDEMAFVCISAASLPGNPGLDGKDLPRACSICSLGVSALCCFHPSPLDGTMRMDSFLEVAHTPNSKLHPLPPFSCSKKWGVFFFVLFLRAGWRTSMSVSWLVSAACTICLCLSTRSASAHWEFWMERFWMLLVPSSACLPGTCLSVQEERKGHKIQLGCHLSFLCAFWLFKKI